MKKGTTESFVQKAQSIYSNKYGYDKVVYENAKEKVTIICNEHGDFSISPNKFLGGGGCQKCSRKSAASKMTKGFDLFFKDAHNVHGKVYDYSNVKFSKRSEKIIIICDQHGEFEQTVSNHLSGQGCPLCSQVKKGLSRRISQDDFFKDCSYIHQNKYDYSDTIYDGMYNEIEPICNIHGKFSVLAVKHLHRQQGCRECSDNELKSKPVIAIQQLLDEYNINYEMEKKFTECKNKLPLPFDFYLPDLNILIEYDGIQHYKPIEYFGGEEGLKQQQYNDEIKTKYCEKNGFELLRITYKENHIEKLKKILNL